MEDIKQEGGPNIGNIESQIVQEISEVKRGAFALDKNIGDLIGKKVTLNPEARQKVDELLTLLETEKMKFLERIEA